jgi:hypothetical protein
MYESIPTAIIPPRRTPRNLTFKKKDGQISNGAGETIVKFPTVRAKT